MFTKIALFIVLIFVTFIPITPVSLQPLLEVATISCPGKLVNGERGDVSYVIDNTGSVRLNITSAHIVIDRNLPSDNPNSAFISSESVRQLPAVLDPKSELVSNGKFISKEDGTHYLDLLLAYSTDRNDEHIVQYYEVCKIDVVPDLSDTSTQIQENMNSVVAVAGAIGGGIVGSYFTYRYGKRIEDEKNKREDKKEFEYKTRIKGLVHSELNGYFVFLSNILEKHPKNEHSDFAEIDQNIYPSYLSEIKALPNQYKELTIDLRAKAFTGEALRNIQKSYEGFSEFKREFEVGNRSYNWIKAKELSEVISTALKSIYDE